MHACTNARIHVVQHAHKNQTAERVRALTDRAFTSLATVAALLALVVAALLAIAALLALIVVVVLPCTQGSSSWPQGPESGQG